jgi:hypothetical protein
LKQAWTRFALIAALTAGVAFAVTPAPLELIARLDGDFLRIAAPHLTFLSGKPLERLKDGGSVAFVAQLTILSSPNAVVADARSVARFALSYDIWEEKFSVTKIGDRPETRRSQVSHLSKEATQNWCLDNLTLDRAALPGDRPFYVQLDLRAEDPRDQLGIVGDPGINITRLIEIFSRPVKGSQPRWLLQTGPLRLADLRKGMHG